jgi:hypothetical protein
VADTFTDSWRGIHQMTRSIYIMFTLSLEQIKLKKFGWT